MPDFFDEILSPGRVGRIYTIGLLLPQEQSDAAIMLSNEVKKKYEVEYTLDTNVRPPFVRLYETVFPEGNKQKIINTVINISKESSPIEMNWGSFETETHNVIMWGELNEYLYNFHKKVLTALNPLREGYFKQKYSNDTLLPPQEEESLIKWGSRWAQNYIPHMVIAKSKNKFKVGQLLDLDWGYRKCILSGMLIGEKIPHGGLKEFQTFPFQGSNYELS